MGKTVAQCRGDRSGGQGRRARRCRRADHLQHAARAQDQHRNVPADDRQRLRRDFRTHQCSQAVKIPIIGCGGIVKVEDVVEYMLAGASAVMIGYLTFRNPSGMIAIIDGLEEWCARKGFARVADLTGAMIYDRPADTLVAAAAPIG
ncbi:MAG: hypothetical protein E6G78_23515 [Alphaproteobacteria bacterium]|nr:MAG: hypothetical protein E6G78_23515 [Alphaproteobacteria bacterium]